MDIRFLVKKEELKWIKEFDYIIQNTDYDSLNYILTKYKFTTTALNLFLKTTIFSENVEDQDKIIRKLIFVGARVNYNFITQALINNVNLETIIFMLDHSDEEYDISKIAFNLRRDDVLKYLLERRIYLRNLKLLS